jgi:DNA modification methylase
VAKVSYKTVELVLDDPISNNEKEVIKEVSLLYPKKDTYLEYEKHKITAYIHSLDLIKFKNTINELLNKYELHNSNNPLKQIIQEIENIKSYGIKGKKRIFVDYNNERKVVNRKSKEKKRGIYYYAEDNNFVKENRELPSDFENKIICGDSEDVLKQLPDNCVDIVFTSPPYNFGLGYDSHIDDAIWQKYFDKLFAVFCECIRVLKYGGRIIVNVQPLFSDYIPIHHMISKFFMDKKMIWKGEVLWEKNNYNCKYTAWGSWKSPSNPYLKYTWEFLEIFCKGTLKKEGDRQNADISGDEFKKWVYAKWSIAPEKKMKQYGHPAMFPENLVDRVLKLFSFRGDVVLDPFNGVGTTTAVAKKLSRRYIGIDYSQEYCDKAKQRLNETLL